MRSVDIDATLATLPLLGGEEVTWRPLEGGLSHHVYRVDAGSASYVLRVLEPAVHLAGLGIEPDLEVANTVSAARAGVGARVFAVLPEVPALLLEFIEGQTLSPADVPSRLGPIAAACRALHAGPRFANEFDIRAKLDQLLAICARHDLPLPVGYTDRLSTVDDIATALRRDPPASVPCHNDLLAENFIQTGPSVRIVDYQLSGNNDPTFELGDIAAESDLDPDTTAALASAYFGAENSPTLVARTRLNLALSNVTWTLWFAIHHALLRAPGSGFDYQGEAQDKWRQACRDLDAPDLGALIDAVTGRAVAPGTAPSRAAVPPLSHPVPDPEEAP